MALTYLNRAPVKFITGTYLGYDNLSQPCDCFTRPFCQLVERGDTTSWQVKLTEFGSGEIVLNGDFATALNWDFSFANWTYDGAGFEADCDGSTNDPLSQFGILTLGKYYKITFTIRNYTVGVKINVSLGNNDLGSETTDGTFTKYGFATVNTTLSFNPSGGWTGSIDDVSIKEMSQLGYEIIDCTDGSSDFDDFTNATITYSEDWAQADFPWSNIPVDGRYNICAHDTHNYKEMVRNGGFDIDILWTTGGTWTIAFGVASVDTNTGTEDLEQTLINPLLKGHCYTITFDVLYTSGSVTVELSDSSTVIGTISSGGAKSFDIDLTGSLINETKIRFRSFIAVSNGNNTMSVDNVSILMKDECKTLQDKCSECYKLALSWDCTFLLDWTNDEDAFGFSYLGLGLVHKMRVEGKFWKPVYREDRDQFLDSAGNESVLYFESNEIRELNVREIPEYMHAALALGVGHDTLNVDSVEQTKQEGDYEPVWRNSSLLAPVIIDLRENNQDNVNSNCT